MGAFDDSCERARSRVSYALDDELSEFDQAVLERHLAGCADCREFAESARLFTAAVRDDALVPFTCGTLAPPRAGFVVGRRSGALALSLPFVTAGVAAALVLQFRTVTHHVPYEAAGSQAAQPGFLTLIGSSLHPTNRIGLPIGQRLARDEFQPSPGTPRSRPR